MTIDSFVPDHQAEKLAMIKDAAGLLDTTLNPFVTAAAADRCGNRRRAEGDGRKAARRRGGQVTRTRLPPMRARLAGTLDRLASRDIRAASARRRRLRAGAENAARPVASRAQPTPMTFQTLPGDLKRGLGVAGGLYRVQAFPSGRRATTMPCSKPSPMRC